LITAVINVKVSIGYWNSVLYYEHAGHSGLQEHVILLVWGISCTHWK